MMWLITLKVWGLSGRILDVIKEIEPLIERIQKVSSGADIYYMDIRWYGSLESFFNEFMSKIKEKGLSLSMEVYEIKKLYVTPWGAR